MIKVVEAHYEGLMCPMVIVGKTSDGSTVYARYRWGHLSVRIDPREDPPLGGAEGTWIFSGQIGDDYDGWITYEELIAVTKGMIEWPEDTSDPRPRVIDGGGQGGDNDDLRVIFS